MDNFYTLYPFVHDYRIGPSITEEWVREQYANEIRRGDDIGFDEPTGIPVWIQCGYEASDDKPEVITYEMVRNMRVAHWRIRNPQEPIPLILAQCNMRNEFFAEESWQDIGCEERIRVYQAIPLTEEEKEKQDQPIKFWREYRKKLDIEPIREEKIFEAAYAAWMDGYSHKGIME